MGARRLAVLMAGMPEPEPEWSIERELAAQHIELTGEVLRVAIAQLRAWLDDKGRQRITVPDSYHVPRPHDVAVRAAAHQTAQVPATATNGDGAHSWPPTLNVPSGRALVRRMLGGE
jgi:hypothetical protein